MLYIGNFLLSRYFVQGINTTYRVFKRAIPVQSKS